VPFLFLKAGEGVVARPGRLGKRIVILLRCTAEHCSVSGNLVAGGLLSGKSLVGAAGAGDLISPFARQRQKGEMPAAA
jgi:hypothetical protein